MSRPSASFRFALVVGHRADAHALGQRAPAGSARRAACGETPGRQPDERLVLGAGAEAQQAGSRPDRGRGCRPAARTRCGRRRRRARSTIEPRMTKRPSPSASVSPTRASSAVSSDGSTTTRSPCWQLAPGRGGLGADLAVERVAGLDGGHLHQPGAAGARHVRHPGEAGEPGHRAPPRQRACRAPPPPPGVQRPAARQREVGAEQGARLAPDRVAQVVGEGVDRHERGDADRDRRREQRAAAVGAARISRAAMRSTKATRSAGSRRAVGDDRAVGQADGAAGPARRGRGRGSPAPGWCPGPG